MPQPETLENIFGAFVNQGTLEDAALWLAELGNSDPQFAKEVVSCLTRGVELGFKGEQSVVSAVNHSGYQVSSPRNAALCCQELLQLLQGKLNAIP